MNKAVSVFILADVIKVNYTDSFVFICIAEISPVFWRLLHSFKKVFAIHFMYSKYWQINHNKSTRKN